MSSYGVLRHTGRAVSLWTWPEALHSLANWSLRYGSGAFIARRFVLKLDPEQFRLLIEALVPISGPVMFWAAATS